MKRLFIVTVSLSLSVGGVHSDVLAQQTQAPVIAGNVNGSCVTAPPAGNPGANAGDWTITCGDINPGSGLTVIGPPTAETVTVSAVGESGPAPAPDPAPEPAPVEEPAPVDEPVEDPAVDAVETETTVDTTA